MSKYEYLDILSSKITDPEKLRRLLDIPESVLAIAASEFYISEEEGEKLDRYPLARKARVIQYNKLADYESPRHVKWRELETKFQSHPDYVPYHVLISDGSVLGMAKTELPEPGTLRDMDLEELGVQVIGAIPQSRNHVELLISYHQYRLFRDPRFHFHNVEELDVFNPKKYDIPPIMTVSELKKFDPNSSIQQALIDDLVVMRKGRKTQKQDDALKYEYYFPIQPFIENPNKYCEVSLPITKV